jgi:hypothetical protein
MEMVWEYDHCIDPKWTRLFGPTYCNAQCVDLVEQ